jgi:4-alpha-glucanotransferase
MSSTNRLLGRRSAGVLMHVTSLPGPLGSGDLSDEALAFVDRLCEAGQSWWQMLPINPPGGPPACSPYSSPSIAAGSPYLISPQSLVEDGFLDRRDLRKLPAFDPEKVDYPAAHALRDTLLRAAYARFTPDRKRTQKAFDAFCRSEAAWLDDECLFFALKTKFDAAPWTHWPKPLRDRDAAALAEARRELADEIRFHQFVQFLFDQQWDRLRAHAALSNVGLIGDMPIFVTHDAVPVWCRPDLWKLDAKKNPTVVSGAPPDLFSDDGQRWGHPLYNWPAHEKEGFRWWIDRFAAMFRKFDAVRIDHFLGFGRLWAVPASAETAKEGKWLPSPGEDLFEAVQRALGPLPMIAEDLGVVTPRAMAIRDQYNFPGMRVAQFNVPPDDGDHAPHNYPAAAVAYTGTHDNDTTVGFLESLKPADRRRMLDYAGVVPGDDGAWPVIRSVFRTAARTAIVPMQDLLGLGSDARMNRPGTAEGNWQWRMKRGAFSKPLAGKLKALTRLYARAADNPTAS